jgi:hypothetical protein
MDEASYVSPAGVARMAVVILAVGACLDGIGIFSTMSQVALIRRIQLGEDLADGLAEANDARQQFIGIVQTIVYLAAVIAFLRWISRVYRNLPALGPRQLSFTSGWAVGAWFVPFLNLVRPFQIVREAWWISATPSEATQAMPGFTPRTPALVGLWWGVFLASAVVGRIAFSVARRAESIPQLLDASYFTIAADVTTAAAALLAIGVIRIISRYQDAAIAPGRSEVSRGGLG